MTIEEKAAKIINETLLHTIARGLVGVTKTEPDNAFRVRDPQNYFMDPVSQILEELTDNYKIYQVIKEPSGLIELKCRQRNFIFNPDLIGSITLSNIVLGVASEFLAFVTTKLDHEIPHVSDVEYWSTRGHILYRAIASVINRED